MSSSLVRGVYQKLEEIDDSEREVLRGCPDIQDSQTEGEAAVDGSSRGVQRIDAISRKYFDLPLEELEKQVSEACSLQYKDLKKSRDFQSLLKVQAHSHPAKILLQFYNCIQSESTQLMYAGEYAWYCAEEQAQLEASLEKFVRLPGKQEMFKVGFLSDFTDYESLSLFLRYQKKITAEFLDGEHMMLRVPPKDIPDLEKLFERAKREGKSVLEAQVKTYLSVAKQKDAEEKRSLLEEKLQKGMLEHLNKKDELERCFTVASLIYQNFVPLLVHLGEVFFHYEMNQSRNHRVEDAFFQSYCQRLKSLRKLGQSDTYCRRQKQLQASILEELKACADAFQGKMPKAYLELAGNRQGALSLFRRHKQEILSLLEPLLSAGSKEEQKKAAFTDEQLMDLFKEETLDSSQLAKKKKKKGKKIQEAIKSAYEVSTSLVKISSKDLSAERSLSAEEAHFFELPKKRLTLASNVKFWMTLPTSTEPSVVEQVQGRFTSYGGNVAYVQKMVRLHGFSQKVDNFLNHPEFCIDLQDRSCFLAEFSHPDGLVERGIITYCFEKKKEGPCYHRFMSKRIDREIEQKSFEDLCLLEEIPVAEPLASREEHHQTEESLDQVSIDEFLGVATIEDKKHKLRIRLFKHRIA